MSATLRHTAWVLRGNPVTAVAAGGTALLALLALAAPSLTPYDPVASDVAHALLPPSAAHWAGTDQLGRDILTRILWAARLDYAIAAAAVAVSFVIGAAIGGAVGYIGGKLDRWVGRITDVLMAFPLFVLAMAMVAAFGNSVANIVLATAVINLPFYIRFARAEVNVRRHAGWVEAARASGNSHTRVVACFLLPNVLPAMAVQVSLNLGWAILNAAGLSFIGLGVHPPTPEWGIMVAEGARFITTGKWWLVCFPGLALMLSVLCFNLLGDGLRDILDPRMRTLTPLLSVESLNVRFTTRGGMVDAVRDVSLAVAAGETLGIVGESGSGKSVTALAAMGLLDRAGRVAGGRIMFRDRDITGASRRVLQPLRGAAMSMVFQNARAALNPIRPVGLQIADVLRAHGSLSQRAAEARAVELLDEVRIREPQRRVHAYPHELSGGMCQRVMIALATACDPALLIADEPTTGLDVTTQKAVMDLLAERTAARGMALVLITHDLGLAAQYCQRVAVMEAGRLVETAPPATLFHNPVHAYTRRLVAASPTRNSTVAGLLGAPEPPAVRVGGPLLAVEGLVKRFDAVAAVDDVSFTVAAGESVGLVGESGSGKSTISRLVCRLLDATAGRITLHGEDIGAIPERDFHRSPHRRALQLVFQDPGDSLNPRFTAADSIANPLRRLLGMRDTTARVVGLAEQVGLDPALLPRFPHQLSGGQKARVGIARALATDPALLVLDEPTAALDVSVQAVVLNLLDRLRRERGLAMLFVSHDLNVVRMMCDRVVVLREGRVVEQGPSSEIFARPLAAYTRELLAVIPHLERAPEWA